MRKFYKGSLITAACLIGTGLILTAAGGAAGIHEAYGILKNEAVDLEIIDHWDMTDDMGETGNTTGDENMLNNTEVFIAENVDQLAVDVGACRLVVREEQMEQEQIRVSYTGNARIKCEMDGDELTVKGYQRKFWLISGNRRAPEIVITIPEGRKLSEVDLKTGAGQAEIYDLKADEISIEAGAGEVIMSQVASKGNKYERRRWLSGSRKDGREEYRGLCRGWKLQL